MIKTSYDNISIFYMNMYLLNLKHMRHFEICLVIEFIGILADQN